ncbi:hypothetical protein [Aureimonas populi]|uniref:DUF1254 domain-containing protein n=1 Tax=Aureimonas populi TaxID=1701758 RepID=A0ABW5CIF8_9HYPH|nr:hypothetical protein [Aureimonas populi]
MIKILLLGLWVAAVSLGSTYVVASVRSGTVAEKEEPTYFAGLDYRRTDAISVPIIAEGNIQGYVLARFVYTIDGQTVATMAVPPDPFVLDEAFRRVYSVSGFDFERPERYDLAALTGDIRVAVNERLGRDVVREVLVEQFDFLPRNEMGGEGMKRYLQ